MPRYGTANPPLAQTAAPPAERDFVAYFPNPIAKRMGFGFDPTPAHIDEAAEHIATFSIAGVRAVARRAL